MSTREINIVFTKSKKNLPIASWLIRLWTWKPYSHVARHKNILNVDMYYHATEGRVNYECARVFDRKHEIVKSYKLEVPLELERNMAKSCLEDAGENYAMMQNLGNMYVDVMKLFGVQVDTPWKKGRNCSELLYVHILKPMFSDLDYNPDTVKPHHIEEILKAKCKIEECCKSQH